MTITLDQINYISTSGVDVISIDLTETLDSDETVSSIATPTESTEAVTLSSASVKSSSWTYKDGTSVSANKGVQCNVTAPATAGTYTIVWLPVTSSSRTLPVATTLVVV